MNLRVKEPIQLVVSLLHVRPDLLQGICILRARALLSRRQEAARDPEANPFSFSLSSCIVAPLALLCCMLVRMHALLCTPTKKKERERRDNARRQGKRK